MHLRWFIGILWAELESDLVFETLINGAVAAVDGAQPLEQVVVFWEGGDTLIAAHLHWKKLARSRLKLEP